MAKPVLIEVREALAFYAKHCPQNSLDGQEGQPTCFKAKDAIAKIDALIASVPDGLGDSLNMIALEKADAAMRNTAVISSIKDVQTLSDAARIIHKAVKG